MASSSTAPSTPEPRPKTTGMRSFTMPPNLASMAKTMSPTQSETGDTQGIEILFVHPSCTIVKFSTSLDSTSASFRSRGLRWSSPTERTVAAGSLEIYRVPGSVSFLHSGELLHAIMLRSQCWCVDGVSKFALRVLPDTYYRIELPANTQDELDAIEDFKTVLSKVMHYERTACPFARNTTEEEDLPELEDSRNKTFSRSDKAKQWKLDRTFSWKGDSGNVVQLRPAGAPRNWRKQSEPSPSSIDAAMSDTIAAIEPASAEPLDESLDAENSESQRSTMIADVDDCQDASTGETVIVDTDKALEAEASCSAAADSERSQEDLQAAPREDPPHGPTTGDEMPEQAALGLESSQPKTTAEEALPVFENHQVEQAPTVEVVVAPAVESPHAQEAITPDQSLQDFRPLQQIPTDMPPSPPDSSAGLSALDESAGAQLAEQLKSSAIQDEAASGANEPNDILSNSTTLVPDQIPHQTGNTVMPVSDQSSRQIGSHRRSSRASSSEDPFAAIQARILARRSIGGTTSFYPPVTRESTSTSTTSVSSSISSRSRMPIGNQRNLASALVQKACTVFLGPPAYLVAMMLRIAARFANGKLGTLYSPEGNDDDTVPGTYHVRDHSSTSEEDEDDYGVAVNSPIRVAAARNLRERKVKQRSEVD